MADVAVPTDGGERPVDLLSTFRRAAALLALPLAIAACDGAPTAAREAADGGAAGGATGAFAAADPALLDALAERLGASGEARRPAVPSWPDDLRFHPGARVESIELVAALEDELGRPYSFTRRFDRLSLREDGERPDAAAGRGEDFAFAGVVRLAGETLVGEADAGGSAASGERDGSSGGTVVDSRAALERLTLGLAVADEGVLGVRDARLERPPAAGEAAGGGCALEQRLGEGESVALRLLADRCPTGARIGSLAFATSATLAVEGTLRVGEERRAVSGHGWTRRVWGDAPPPSGGAVRFDRLLLEVAGLGLIEAERSKRASGRGPRTTTARLRGAERDEEVSAEWQDVSASGEAVRGEGANAVPGAWRLRVASLEVDLTLVPPAGGLARRELAGRTWRGAVRAEGSHEGVGFVEFSLLDPAPASAGSNS